VSTEENKALIRSGFEAMSSKDTSVFERIIAPSYINHDMPAPAPGPEGFKQVVGAFFTAFPDMRVTIDDQLAERNLVANRGTFTGTHEAEFMGIPATGKQVMVKFIDIWRVENGQAVENWVQLDMMGLMVQLGVVPSPAGQA
jgi:predicted ester cyclase